MYSVYKITNILNGKYYIGVHKTKEPCDGYMGSGVAIKEAIKKYGRENFIKEVLLLTPDKKDAYEAERILTESFNKNDNYNMRRGGVGGFTRENARKGYLAANWSKELLAENARKGLAKFTKEDLIANGRKGGLSLKGKPKSEKHKERLREAWKKKQERSTIG